MDDFVTGAEVRVDGLVSASRHNGKVGKIVDVFPDENKVQVILDDDDKSNIKVATGKLTLIRPAGRPAADSMLLDARKASASAPASASASLRKIPVVLLGEMHNDLRCAKDNLPKLKAIGFHEMTPSQFLLVSEGRCVNPCFRLFVERFRVPDDRILLEYDTLTKSSMLNGLLLETITLQNLLDGTVKQGTGAAAGPGIPDSQTVEPKWFMERAKEEYGPLLEVVPNGTTMYEQMVAAAFSRNTQQFYSFYNSILDYLIKSDYLNDIPMSDHIKRRLKSFIETGNDRELREVSVSIMSSRDADIIRKVEERARSENSTLKTIVIIFGAMHFDNLRTLIQRSDVLEFDSARSSNIKFGGKKMKKVKKRISKSHLTKKCNSKSKKYNSKSKKCKTHRK